MNSTTHTHVMPQLEEVDAITATEMKNAHGKRLPEILRKKGVARVTRYSQTDYYVLSPDMFTSLMKGQRPENSKLQELRAKYQDLVANMQTPQNQDAFAALAQASDSELGAAAKVG